MVEMPQYILASSAKNLIKAVITPGKSLIKIRKRTDPKTIPLGTPLVTLTSSEDLPSTCTYYLRSVKKSLIHACILSLIPYAHNFFSNLLWGTLSNGLRNSIYITSTSVP